MAKKLLAIRLPQQMTEAIARFCAHARIRFSQGVAFLLFRSLRDQVNERRAWSSRDLDYEYKTSAKYLESALASWRKAERAAGQK